MNTDRFSKVVVVDVDLQATRTLSVRDNSYGLACFKEAICLLCDGLRYIVFSRFATASFASLEPMIPGSYVLNSSLTSPINPRFLDRLHSSRIGTRERPLGLSSRGGEVQHNLSP